MSATARTDASESMPSPAAANGVSPSGGSSTAIRDPSRAHRSASSMPGNTDTASAVVPTDPNEASYPF